MGGQGLYSTVSDYLKFMYMWLSGGRGSGDYPLLKEQTVWWARSTGIAPLAVHTLPGVNPKIANTVEFFPGLPTTWVHGFLKIEADAPTGRKKGSISWCGVGNLYMWIDPDTGIAGLWATQLLPFFDGPCVAAAEAFEAATYRAIRRR